MTEWFINSISATERYSNQIQTRNFSIIVIGIAVNKIEVRRFNCHLHNKQQHPCCITQVPSLQVRLKPKENIPYNCVPYYKHRLLSIKCYQFIANDCRTLVNNWSTSPYFDHLSMVPLFGHIARMDDNVDAKILTASITTRRQAETGKSLVFEQSLLIQPNTVLQQHIKYQNCSNTKVFPRHFPDILGSHG